MDMLAPSDSETALLLRDLGTKLPDVLRSYHDLYELSYASVGGFDPTYRSATSTSKEKLRADCVAAYRHIGNAHREIDEAISTLQKAYGYDASVELTNVCRHCTVGVYGPNKRTNFDVARRLCGPCSRYLRRNGELPNDDLLNDREGGKERRRKARLKAIKAKEKRNNDKQ